MYTVFDGQNFTLVEDNGLKLASFDPDDIAFLDWGMNLSQFYAWLAGADLFEDFKDDELEPRQYRSALRKAMTREKKGTVWTGWTRVPRQVSWKTNKHWAKQYRPMCF